MMPTRDTPLILKLRPILRQMNHKMVRHYGPHFPGRRLILLLTTKGRNSGTPRITPLQYERFDGMHWVASGWGKGADWVKNIRKEPHVSVQVGAEHYQAKAELIEEAGQVADFLELRLDRHPLMVGWMLHAQGLPAHHTRQDMERMAQDVVVVKLIPVV
jgi:deazaflavin-dependent oxidoreductase (nitroreductase family)